MSQLHIDLERRINETLVRWFKQSLDLYSMADVPVELALIATVKALMRALVTVMETSEYTPDETLALMRHLLQARAEHNQNRSK